MFFSTYPKQSSLESRLQFWALLGPFFILAAIFVSAYRFIPLGAYMPFWMLLTLPLLIFGNKRVIFLAATLYFALFLYSFSRVPPAYRIWEMGVLMTVSLGVWITALSFDEILLILKEAKSEAKNRLDSLLKMDEKLKTSEEEGEKHKQLLSDELLACEQKIQELEERLVAKQHVLEEKERQLNKVLEDSEALKGSLNEQLLSYEQQVKDKEASFSKEREELHAELDTLRASLDTEGKRVSKEREAFKQYQIQATEQVRVIQGTLEDELANEKERVSLLKEQCRGLEKQQEESHELFLQQAREKKELLEQLNQQRVSKFQLKLNHKYLFRQFQELRRQKKKSGGVQPYETLYKQLKKQFYDKDKVLVKTRHALFHSEEKNLLHEREKQEKALEPSDLLKAYQRDMASQNRENEELKKELHDLYDLIHAWSS